MDGHSIPAEPIGSIRRPHALMEAIAACGDPKDRNLDSMYDSVIRDTIAFSDGTSTSRETAFAKIRAQVPGTAFAPEMIGDR